MKTDYQTISVEVRDGVAIFTMNNPPVNQLSAQFRSDLAQAFGEAYDDQAVKAIVLTGTGKNFIAGADITEILEIENKEELVSGMMEGMKFMNHVETGPKAVVAAINGNCLGGGLELAMCCHYRVAVNGINLGQPEVQIGLIPGAGGTQRLPRLVGLRHALEMITIGKPIKAEVAYQRRLVDEIAGHDKLIEAAVAAAGRFISGEMNIKARATRNRHYWIPSAAEKKAMMDFTKAMTAA